MSNSPKLPRFHMRLAATKLSADNPIISINEVDYRLLPSYLTYFLKP